jgi:cytochrome c2
MTGPFQFYTRFVVLFVVILLMVCFNFLTWGFHRTGRQSVWHVAQARPERGPALLREYGCSACHTLPEFSQTTKAIGPSLERVNDRMYIAGTLSNTPPNLISWIQDPQKIRPQTAMPNLGVGLEDARDIAAYLYDPQLTDSLP